MALQYSTTIRNNQLDQVESTTGTAPTLTIRSGTIPANCAAADSAGTTLATITLPSDWMGTAVGGSKTILGGPWTDPVADNTGTAGYFRIKDQSTACHIQGTVGTSAADMIVDSVSFTAGQSFSVNSFTITAGNA